MAFDELLADRIREALGDRSGIKEKRMFGGLAFLLNGNMAVGIVGDRLMIRFDKTAHEFVLSHRHVSPMDFTHRPMRGFAFVEKQGIATDEQLGQWVGFACDYAGALPSK